MRRIAARWLAAGLALSLAALLPAGAAAQDNSGARVEALAGVAGFSGAVGARVDPGPTWGALAEIPTGGSFALAAAYRGALTLVPTESGRRPMLSTGVLGGMELAPLHRERFRPYVFAGLGLLRTEVPRASQATFRSDTTVTLPAGLGFSAGVFKRVTVGARLGWDLALDNGLLRGRRGSSGDLWSGTLTIGLAL